MDMVTFSVLQHGRFVQPQLGFWLRVFHRAWDALSTSHATKERT